MGGEALELTRADGKAWQVTAMALFVHQRPRPAAAPAAAEADGAASLGEAKETLVSLTAKDKAPAMELGRGFKPFCRDNNLRVGDIVDFTFVRPPGVMSFVVTRGRSHAEAGATAGREVATQPAAASRPSSHREVRVVRH